MVKVTNLNKITQSLADDLAWLCNELEIAKPVAIGHSMGGLIVLELAARFPDLLLP